MQHPSFTSTLTHIPSFNIYIIIITALIFFTVLSWFNFVLAWYGTLITTDPEHKDQTLVTFGYAIIWTIITIIIYTVMNTNDVLSYGPFDYGKPPLRPMEAGGSFETNVLGSINMAAI